MNLLRRVALALVVLAAGVPAAAAAERQQAPAAQAPDKPDQPPQQKPADDLSYEETVVVSASRTDEKLVNAPATMSVILAQTIENAPTRNFAELLRVGARPQHHPGVGPRHQRHEPRRHRHAGDRPARAARRPQSLPGLLRVRHVGLPAGQPQRDQAGRGDPRPGLGRLGRQRRQRRGQRDHQVAARDAGHQRHVRLRHVRPVGGRPRRRRRRDVCTSAAPMPRPSTTGGPSSCRAGAIRRMRWRGRPASFPVLRARSYPAFTNTGTTQPKFDGRLDYDFEDGRRLSFAGGVRRHRRHHAHRHRAVRHQHRLDDGLREGEFRPQGAARERVHQRARRQRLQPADARHQLPADRLRLPDQHLRPRALERQRGRPPARPQLRRQFPLQQVRPVARAGRRRPQGVRRLRPGRDLPLAPCSGG